MWCAFNHSLSPSRTKTITQILIVLLVYLVYPSNGNELHQIRNSGPFSIYSSENEAGEFGNLTINVERHGPYLATLLDFFDPEKFADSLILDSELLNQDYLGEVCKDDMQTYLTALSEGQTWAFKMSDATGRPPSGFLWENDYWLGSQQQCNNLGSKNRRKNATLSTPPFTLQFAMVSMQINVSITNSSQIRQVTLGLCLPHSCNREDVVILLQTSASSTAVHSLTDGPLTVVMRVLNVRSLNSGYSFWRDPKSVTVFTAVVCAVLLMIAGSLYDYFVFRKMFIDPADNPFLTYDFDPTAERDDDDKEVTMEMAQRENGVVNGTVNGVLNGDYKKVPVKLDITKQPKKYKPGLLGGVLMSFSVLANGRKIFDSNVGEDTIAPLHGLRFISLLWVILGHTCYVSMLYSDNKAFKQEIEKEFLYHTIGNGPYAVDTFFFISGLLVSFLYFRTKAKVNMSQFTSLTGFKAKFLEYLFLVGYRFWRLTPPYLFVIGLIDVTMNWFYHYSLFDPPTKDHVNCGMYWWRNVLYINNLFPSKDMCMVWSWYLANDTQFYLIGMVILIIALSYLPLAAFLYFALIVLSWITTAALSYSHNFIPSISSPLALFDVLYMKPYTRIGPYFVGMGIGYLLYRTNCEMKINRILVIAGWMLAAACNLSILYGLNNNLSVQASAAYVSLSHTAWALGLAWIVVACCTGHGWLINDFLSWPIMYPLSRITYCAYLVHLFVIRVVYLNRDAPVHLDPLTICIFFFGHAVASYTIGFFISLAFEAPLISLFKIALKMKKKPR